MGPIIGLIRGGERSCDSSCKAEEEGHPGLGCFRGEQQEPGGSLDSAALRLLFSSFLGLALKYAVLVFIRFEAGMAGVCFEDAGVGFWAVVIFFNNNNIEAYAAAKTYKVAVYVIPAPLDLPAAAYNDGAKDKIALWFTDKPGHFDWLRPAKGDELPEELRTIATDTQPGTFPRGGGGGREAGAQSEATFFTGFGGAGGGQLADTHSEATVFTSKLVADVGKASTDFLAAPAVAIDTAVLASAGDLAAPALEQQGSCCASGPVAAGFTVRDWLAKARRAGSEAFTGRLSTASAADAGCALDEEDTVGEMPEQPPRPQQGPRRRCGTGQRTKHAAWTCAECGWSTGRTVYWPQKKAAHIANFHPDIKRELSLRLQAIQMVPYCADTCCWKCPVPGCNLGLPATESTSDGRRLARLRHAETHHPDEPKDLFLLKVGTATGARKATVAKLSAGVAKRIQRLKAGEAGHHDVVCVKLPPPPNSAVSKAGKRRRALSKLICKRCKRISADCKDMAAHPCKLVVGNKRRAMQQRLQEALDAGNLDDDICEGITCVLDIFKDEAEQQQQPRQGDAHQLKALAWPLDTKHFTVKFACTKCGGIWKRLREAEGKPCVPARTRVRYSEASQLRQLVGTPGVVGQTAAHALGFLHEKGTSMVAEEREELARGLGQHA